MTPHRASRALTTAAVLGIGVLAACAAVAPAETGYASAARITGAGVDGVKLGMTFQTLRQRGLVGRIRRGCELSGPNARSARLLSPLRGAVDFTLTTPRKARFITIRGGARARGVGVGSTISAIKAAFPRARVNHSTDATFGITLVTIPRSGGGKFQFGVSTSTHKTTLIGIPVIPFCE
jgi:hypothetical protein